MAPATLPEAVTFDCYGTIIDWETGLERGILWLLREKADPPGLDKVVEAWNLHERALTSGKDGYRRYREIVSEALRLAFADFDVPWDPRDGHRLAEGMGRWEPFADAPGALELLRHTGYRTAILSNTDQDILEHSLRRIGVPFDLTVVAEQVKAYKPDEQMFQTLLERLELPAERVLHVSVSPYHDLEPAKRLGFRTFFVDRRGIGESEVEVDLMGRDLGALAEVLTRV